MSDDLRSLARRGRDLDLQIKAASEELKEIKSRFIQAGAGEYEGTDGAKALVIFPKPSIKPDETAIAKIKRIVSPSKFAKLFVETVILTPVKEFRGAVLALFDEERASEIITLCEKEGSPQVRFS